MAMMALQIPPDCDQCFCGRCSTTTSATTIAKQYYQGHGEPNDTDFLPEDQTIENLYTDLDTQILYAWVPGELRWI